MSQLKLFCLDNYSRIFAQEYGASSLSDSEQRERFAQKRAIRDTIILALKQFVDVDGTDIRNFLYTAHVKRKSGVEETEESIQHIISADNSWKKSSGHAFEEMITLVGNEVLSHSGLTIYLQKEVTDLLKRQLISNESRDLREIRQWLKASSFDLFITAKTNDREVLFGCIQTKTSIRDRVTRDREPSRNAMAHFFWSVAFVLDGDFLKLPKFQHMVNGGGEEFEDNGWHGMYVFSRKYTKDRIYPINAALDIFVGHALQAAKFWQEQRQWFNSSWQPT